MKDTQSREQVAVHLAIRAEMQTPLGVRGSAASDCWDSLQDKNSKPRDQNSELKRSPSQQDTL